MPPSSATIVGRAGATSVMLREATSEPSIRPAKTARTPRSTPFASAAPAAFEATAVTVSRLARSRETQDSFGQDVAQDLGGARFDRVGARAKEEVLPPVAVPDLRRRTRDVHRRLGHALIELGPHQLQDRTLGPRDPVSLDRGDGAIAVELQRAGLDRVLRDPLPDEGI